MLTVCLVDTALSLIPTRFHGHPAVKSNLDKFGKAGLIWDTALHHTLIKQDNLSERISRPDILHQFLLNGLGSYANLANQLNLLFECPSGLYQISPQMKCPRDFIRFKGLMTQLLQIGQIPPTGNTLIQKLPENAQEYLQKRFAHEKIFIFTKAGTETSLNNLIALYEIYREEPIAAVIGGFPHGSLSPWIDRLNGTKIALSTIGMDSWTIVNRAIIGYELAHNLI